MNIRFKHHTLTEKIERLEGKVEYYKYLYEDEEQYCNMLVFDIIKPLRETVEIQDEDLKKKIDDVIEAMSV